MSLYFFPCHNFRTYFRIYFLLLFFEVFLAKPLYFSFLQFHVRFSRLCFILFFLFFTCSQSTLNVDDSKQRRTEVRGDLTTLLQENFYKVDVINWNYSHILAEISAENGKYNMKLQSQTVTLRNNKQ